MAKEEFTVQDNGQTIEATRTMLDHIKALKDIREELAELEAREKEYETKLKKLIGENAEVEKNGVTIVTWKTVVSNRLDTKVLKEELPDVYNKYTKASKTRKFLLK